MMTPEVQEPLRFEGKDLKTSEGGAGRNRPQAVIRAARLPSRLQSFALCIFVCRGFAGRIAVIWQVC